MGGPLRIASLLSSATEMLCGMGLQQQLVAISHECDYPAPITTLPRVTQTRLDATASSQAIDEEVRFRLSAGEPLYEVNTSLLEQLAPDLIITQAQCEVCAVRLADVEAAVAGSDQLCGAEIVSLNPESIGDVLHDIQRIGNAAGATAQADDYTEQLKARIAEVRRATETLVKQNQRPRRMVLIEWIEPLMLSGNWMPELVAWAGGEHALTEAGKHSPYVNWEDVVRYDPEVIVIAPCGFDLNRTLTETGLLQKLPGWNKLSAVQAARVYAMDGNAYFNRSGPRLVDSLEILAHLIYPESIPQPTCVADPALIWQPIA